MTDLGLNQNEIVELGSLSNLRYENIFKIYQNTDSQYFYNILNTVTFGNIYDPNLFTEVVVSEKMPWTVLSYNAYKTIDLWWLIALVNGVRNPFELPSDNKIKILKPQYVATVISQLSQLIA